MMIPVEGPVCDRPGGRGTALSGGGHGAGRRVDRVALPPATRVAHCAACAVGRQAARTVPSDGVGAGAADAGKTGTWQAPGGAWAPDGSMGPRIARGSAGSAAGRDWKPLMGRDSSRLRSRGSWRAQAQRSEKAPVGWRAVDQGAAVPGRPGRKRASRTVERGQWPPERSLVTPLTADASSAVILAERGLGSQRRKVSEIGVIRGTVRTARHEPPVD
jgi:hypothetical protein